MVASISRRPSTRRRARAPPRRRARWPGAPGPRSRGRRSPSAGARAGCPRCPRAGSAALAARTRSSTASRVVPGIAETTARSRPSSRLRIDDLPTLGRPTSASADGRGLVLLGRSAGQAREGRVEQVADPLAVLGRDRSGPPRSRGARTRTGPRPRPSTLLTTTSDPLARRAAAGARSPRRRAGGRRGRPPRSSTHVGLVDRPLGLLGRRARAAGRRCRGAARRCRSSSKAAPLPGRLGVVAVAGRARPAVGDGLAAAADAVEERRLADVRPADEGDSGQGDHGSRGPLAV